jgi:hypothetical protein
MYTGLHVKYRYCCQILVKVEFSRQFFEKSSKYQILLKIRPVGAELFHAAGQTDRHDEANSPFSQFCERGLK